MFFRPELLKRDPAFADDGYGRCWRTVAEGVAHSESLRAGFGLTGEEFSPIVAELGFDDQTPLTLDNISADLSAGVAGPRAAAQRCRVLLLSPTHGPGSVRPARPAAAAGRAPRRAG